MVDFLLSASENKLCASCKKLLRRYHDAAQEEWQDEEMFNPVQDQEDHHEDSESFLAAAEKGCRICGILLRYHLRGQGDLVKDIKISASLWLDQNSCAASYPGHILFTMSRKDDVMRPSMNIPCLYATIYKENSQEYHHLRETCRSSPLSESTDDPAVMELAKLWLKSCNIESQGHDNCTSHSKECFRPARLLDVSRNDLHLSLANERVVQEPYCALSYCWGTTGQPKLTISNAKDFVRNIDFSTLPKTIQDAIRITRDLGIRYVWIDSLCIIQEGDNGKDWQLHSTAMRRIYSNSALNISADRASTVDEGFLGPRAWPALRPVFNDGKLGKSILRSKCVITFNNVADIALATEPLGSRAWVLCERISSPKTLHFGAGEMFWECSGCSIASESCPKGFGTELQNFIYANFAFSNKESSLTENWMQILTNYTRLSLTMPASDKLVALAGVAQLYEQKDLTLVAGIVKESLPQSLLWKRFVHLGSPSLTGISPTYRAPSWSWASIDGPLDFSSCARTLESFEKVSEVQSIWIKPKEGHTHFGQIDDGAITISGPAISLMDVDSSSLHGRKFPLQLSVHYSDGEMEQNLKAIAIVMFLIVSNPGSGGIQGLVVIPSQKENTWARVGVLVVVLKIDDDIVYESPRMSPGCQAFLDSMERKTLTII